MATKIKRRLSFTFFKKHKKIAIFLICIAIFASSFAFINYSRYVKNIVKVYYLRTKNFYFNSNLLVAVGEKTYTTQPWVIGNNQNFAISVEMNSRLNSLKTTDYDISYKVTCDVEGSNKDNVECNIKVPETETSPRNTPAEFVIPGNTATVSPNTNTFVVEVKPTKPENLKNGDEVIVKVTATSTAPYEIELSAKFKLIVGDYAISYDIIDKPNQRYFDVVITNSVPTKGYMVTLDISNLEEVALDQSTHIIDTIKEYDDYVESPGKYDSKYIITTRVNSIDTIKSIKFLVEENSGALVRFYKKDPKQDYSYDSGLFKGTNMTDSNTTNIVKASFECYDKKYVCKE